MKHVGKRKVFISVLAMLLVLALTGAALAGSYPSPAFVLPGVKDRPQETKAPEATAAPEATDAPAEAADPEQTTEPDATPAPEVTEDPEVHIDLEATEKPEATVEPEATDAPETTVEPEVTVAPDATVAPETGVTLETVVEPESSATPAPENIIAYQRDEAGNLVLDENGNPIPIVPSDAPEATVEPESAPVDTIAYQRDEAGNLILDENGNPIAIVPEGMEAPAAYLRDENGNLVLDENGNPIPVNTAPEGAKKLSEIVDEQFPNRSIHIYAMFDGDYLNIGDSVTLIAVLNGYEGLVYHYQWQVASAGGWSDISGAQDSAYVFKLTEENASSQWRIVVTITDVQGN